MLDDTLGPALVATLGPGQFAPTADLHVQFLRPVGPGRLTGRGRVVRRGSNVAFLAGELLDESGQTVAVATATALIRASQGLIIGSGTAHQPLTGERAAAGTAPDTGKWQSRAGNGQGG
jgi:hypothetical protein